MPNRKVSAWSGLKDLPGNRIVLFLLLLSGILLVAALTAAFSATRSLAASNARVEHTLRVEAAIMALAGFNERIETARRGYLIAPDPSLLAIMRGTQEDLKAQIDQVEALVIDNPLQSRRLERIRALEAQRSKVLSNSILTPMTIVGAARENGLASDPGVIIVRQVRASARQMMQTEEDLLFARNRAQAASQSRFYFLGGLATLLLTITLVSVIALVLRYNRELTRAEAGLRVANEDLENAVSRRTAQLTRANDEIQRFAYIVSHDLRSPLVNVLGFTAELDESRKQIRKFLENLFTERPELRDQEVWLAADEDLPEALDFIRKSTEKMDRLINSILDLSRQGRRQLAPERLNMAELVDGVVSSLHQHAEAAGASVAIEPIPPIESDRIAVEQILSNLTENALKYLQPGRPGRIVISGERRGRSVAIAVADNGRGIAVEDQERVFELFRRAGTQDQPGEGIGLANVRALAYRLGGFIELQSVPGEGSTFTLVLPESFAGGDIRE